MTLPAPPPDHLSADALAIVARWETLDGPPYVETVQRVCGMADLPFKVAVDELVALGLMERRHGPSGMLIYATLRGFARFGQPPTPAG